MFLFVQYLWSLGFLYVDIPIGGREWLEGVLIVFDVFVDLEGRGLNVLLEAVMLSHHSFGLIVLVLARRYRDILDDWYLQSGLALRVFMHFGFLQLVLAILITLVVV